MARSLFAMLHRRYGAKLSGAEIVARARSKQLEFSGRLGLSSLPKDCPLPNGVAVVGGGFAGMAAAWTLDQAGVASTVFEARKTYGGRVETDRTFIPGRLIEAGAELIGMNHPMWLGLAKRFGLGMIVLTGEDQYDGMGLESPLFLGGKPVPDREKLYKQMKFVLQRISDDAKAITDPFAPWTTPGAAALDATSVADKIARFVTLLPKPTRHPMLVDALELQLGNDQVLPTKQQSYLALLALVSGGRMGKGDVDLTGLWEHHEDYRCAEGNDTLAGMMLEFSKRITFRPSSPVTKIEISETEPLVKVTWLDASRGAVARNFDAVVLAVPPSVWKKIAITPALPPGNEMTFGAAVKYMSQVPGRFWIKGGLSPSGLSDTLGQTWEATENQALASKGTVLSVFAGGAFIPATDPVKHFKAELSKLYPGYRAIAERYADWPKVSWIEAGYVSPKVGQVTTIAKFLNVPYKKRLYFAGEHTCMAYFGYMEGALQSGAMAARAILESCGSKAASTPGKASTPRRSESLDADAYGEQVLEAAEACASNGTAARGSAGLLSSLFSGEWDEASTPHRWGFEGHRPTATTLFNAFVYPDHPACPRQALQRHYARRFEVLARPGDALPARLPQAGDLLVRVARGEGWGHVAVVASPGLYRHHRLAERGLRGEGYPLPLPGWHVHVVEAGPRPRSAADRFARRLGDASGLVLADTLLLRPLHPDAEAAAAPRRDRSGDAAEPPAARPTTLRRGASGAAVREAQQKLNRVHADSVALGLPGLTGAPLNEDGRFDQKTEQAVADFQQQVFGDPAQWNGVIDADTWAQLDLVTGQEAAPPSGPRPRDDRSPRRARSEAVEADQPSEDTPSPVLKLEKVKVSGLREIPLTPGSGRFEGFFANPIHERWEPTSNVQLEVTGRIQIDTSGSRRNYDAKADGVQWPLAGATGAAPVRIVKADGPSISGVPDVKIRPDGTFVLTAQLVVDGYTRSLTIFPKVTLKNGTKLSATVVVELIDLDGLLALIDPKEKARPASRTHLEFLASVRKLFQGGPTDPLAGAFDLTLYRHRNVPPLVAVASAEYKRFELYKNWIYADGVWLDIGHVLTGIEGSPKQKPSKDQSIPVPRRPELLVTWAGDLGSALQAYIRDFWNAVDKGDPLDLDDHLSKRAGTIDLVGDIDGINIGSVYDASRSLSENLRAYYGVKSRRRYHEFIANSKDDKGKAELPLVAGSKPPRLDKPARQAIAAQVRGFLEPLWITGKLYGGSDATKRAMIDEIIKVDSPEMDIVVGYFARFLEDGLARER